MRVWLVKFEEPLPVDQHPRLYRMGMLAEALEAAGHQVVWWSSTLDYSSGRLRYDCDTLCEVRPGYQLRLLHTGAGGRRAVSGGRLFNNVHQAVRFFVEAKHAPRPDLIVCAMPTPELAWVSSRLAAIHRVPFVLDARDMWPDVFADLLPPLIHLAARPYLALMRAMLSSAARQATGCISITEPFLDWILGYARRRRGPSDGVFPIGFQEPVVGAAELETAEATLPVAMPEDFNVVFLGRLNRTVFDAFPAVLDAATRLRGGRRRFRFYIAGQGDCAAQLRDMCSQCAEVTFLGQLDAPALAALKRRAHVALLCIARRRDYQISLSNKIFEYLAAGLPVASHLTGLPGKLVTEESCGFVYDDGAELAVGLMRYSNDEAARCVAGRRAQTLFRERFESVQVYRLLRLHLESLCLAESFE